jgi:formate-dependent nitrite reductase membrane component NrfD
MKTTHTLIYSLSMGIALILYFLLINTLGYGEQSYLSLFNSVIVGVGIFFVIRDVYKNETQFKYMEGFVAGVKSGFIATLIFTIFMAIYLFEIDPELAVELKSQINTAGEGIRFSLLLFILLSGLATSMVTPLLILPLYKKSWNTREVRSRQKPMNQ